MTQREKAVSRINVLLRDYGYSTAMIDGKFYIVKKTIRQFYTQTIGNIAYDSPFSIMEALCPIIRDDEYTRRMNKIGE